MNIKILNRFIKTADRLVISSPTLPILGQICIENGIMKVTDLENTLIVPVEDKRSYTIPFKTLKAVLKQKPEDLKIEIEKDDKLSLLYGKRSLTVQRLNPEDFPLLPKGKFRKIDEWNAEKLTKLLGQLPFISKEELRPALTGVLLEYNDEIRAVSTDGHIMRVTNFGNGSKVKEVRILPNKALRILSAPPLKPVEFYSSSTHAKFEWQDGTILYTRWIDETYPDYKPFVENWRLKGSATFDVKELLAAISDAKPFVNKVTQGIRMRLSNGLLELVCEDTDNQISFKASVPLPSNLKSEGLDMAFNALFLETILKGIGTEKVVLRFDRPDDKTYWIDEIDDPEIINLLMPIRLVED